MVSRKLINYLSHLSCYLSWESVFYRFHETELFMCTLGKPSNKKCRRCGNFPHSSLCYEELAFTKPTFHNHFKAWNCDWLDFYLKASFMYLSFMFYWLLVWHNFNDKLSDWRSPVKLHDVRYSDIRTIDCWGKSGHYCYCIRVR